MCFVLSFEIIVQFAQVIVLKSYILRRQLELLGLIIESLLGYYALMVYLLLQSMNCTIASLELILEILDPILPQVASVIQIIVLLLETLVLKNSNTELLLHLFHLLA